MTKAVLMTSELEVMSAVLSGDVGDVVWSSDVCNVTDGGDAGVQPGDLAL